MVVDGETGRLVQAGTPLALADAIEHMISDPRSGKLMGKLGRKRVSEEFSLRGMVDEIERLYGTVHRRVNSN